MSNIQVLNKRFSALKQETNTWIPTLKDLSKYIRPTRGFFDGAQPNQGRALDHKTIIDGHAGRALRILASGMTSGLTSPARPWFKLGVPDADMMDFHPVKLWLATVEERMMAVFAKSNIYGFLHSIYEEIGLFGTAAGIILEDRKDVIRCRNFTAGEYVLGCGADGRVNTMGRSYFLTVGQMVEEFGIENCSDQVQKMFDNNQLDQWIKIRHLIEPNDDRMDVYKDDKHMPFRSVYWEEGSNQTRELRCSGFEEFPVLAPRWDTTTTADALGKGPGWDALGDVKMLQKLQKDKLIALDKLINPPMQQDSSVQGEANMLPGGLTRYSGTTPNAGVKPAYQIQPDLNAIEMSIQRTQNAISATFYSDLFLMMANTERSNVTATEIARKYEEKLLMLGPVLERLESELLDPTIDRTFGIMLRGNLIPEPPKELQGQDLKIEYISMLAQAQKMVGTTAVEQAFGFVGNLAAAFPQVLDVMDADEAVIEYSRMLGLPPKIVRSHEDIAAIRQQKQQAAQAQQQQAVMMNLAQGAKTLADTKMGTNSALDALVGSGTNSPSLRA